MAGVLSKGIKLGYKNGEGSTYTNLTNLQEIPDLGGESEAIEITTLADEAHMYMNGILNYGDSLGFKFLYEDTDGFGVCDKTNEECRCSDKCHLINGKP